MRTKIYPPTQASTVTSTDCLYLCDACTLRVVHIILHSNKLPRNPEKTSWGNQWFHSPLILKALFLGKGGIGGGPFIGCRPGIAMELRCLPLLICFWPGRCRTRRSRENSSRENWGESTVLMAEIRDQLTG